MVVITGIKTVIKLAPVIYRVSKVIYKGVKKTRSFDRYMARHPKVLKYGTAGVGIGTLIYDLTNIDYDSLLGTNPTSYRKQQARGYIQSPGSRFKQYAKCPTFPRRRFSEQRQFDRSRYR